MLRVHSYFSHFLCVNSSYLQDKGIQKDKSGIYSIFEHMCTSMFQLHIDDISQQVHVFTELLAGFSGRTYLFQEFSTVGSNMLNRKTDPKLNRTNC